MSDLDKICCEFAGIEPVNMSTNETTGEVFLWYPPVSTDWAWAGKLIDCLAARGIGWSRTDGGWVTVGHVPYRRGGASNRGGNFTMSLCLTVAQFALDHPRNCGCCSTIAREKETRP